jgi:hypothetical protein
VVGLRLEGHEPHKRLCGLVSCHATISPRRSEAKAIVRPAVQAKSTATLSPGETCRQAMTDGSPAREVRLKLGQTPGLCQHAACSHH